MTLLESLRVVMDTDPRADKQARNAATKIVLDRLRSLIGELGFGRPRTELVVSVDDLAQRSFLKLISALTRNPSRLTSFESDDKAKGYLRRLVENVLRDHVRKLNTDRRKIDSSTAVKVEDVEKRRAMDVVPVALHPWAEQYANGEQVQGLVLKVVHSLFAHFDHSVISAQVRDRAISYWNDFFDYGDSAVTSEQLALKWHPVYQNEPAQTVRTPRADHVEAFMRSFKRARQSLAESLELGTRCPHPKGIEHAYISLLEFVAHCWQRALGYLPKHNSFPDCP